MAACLAMLVLTGCVSASWIAHRIVRPSTNSRASDSFRTFAHSFFSQRVILKVRPPDAGTIVASVMQPAPYDPDIGIVYKPGGKTESIELNFPRSVPPPRSALSRRLAELAKKDSFKAALESWRVWLSTLKAEKPVGTVIMLPGFGLDKDSLLPWALFFADRGWRVVLVDLRGQGRSQAPYLTWGIRDRNDLHRLVRALERRHILVKPWLYFGVSYGAGVALMAAAGAPGPDGVIAVAPWADADRVIARAGHRWGGWIAPGVDSPEWAKAEEIAGRLAGINLADAQPRRSVALIHTPVLYLGGQADRVAPPSELRALARRTPRATLVLRPGLPHAVVATDVPAFCPAITRWLAQALHQIHQRPCIVHRRRGKTKDIHETYLGDP